MINESVLAVGVTVVAAVSLFDIWPVAATQQEQKPTDSRDNARATETGEGVGTALLVGRRSCVAKHRSRHRSQ